MLAHLVQTFLDVRGKFAAADNVYSDVARVNVHVQDANVEFGEFDMHDRSSAVAECVGILRQEPSGLRIQKSDRAVFRMNSFLP